LTWIGDLDLGGGPELDRGPDLGEGPDLVRTLAWWVDPCKMQPLTLKGAISGRLQDGHWVSQMAIASLLCWVAESVLLPSPSLVGLLSTALVESHPRRPAEIKLLCYSMCT
jgi:hypothetical protein